MMLVGGLKILQKFLAGFFFFALLACGAGGLASAPAGGLPGGAVNAAAPLDAQLPVPAVDPQNIFDFFLREDRRGFSNPNSNTTVLNVSGHIFHMEKTAESQGKFTPVPCCDGRKILVKTREGLCTASAIGASGLISVSLVYPFQRNVPEFFYYLSKEGQSDTPVFPTQACDSADLSAFEKDPVFSEQGPDAAMQRVVTPDSIQNGPQIPLNAGIRTFLDDKPTLEPQNPVIQNRFKSTGLLQFAPTNDQGSSTGTSSSGNSDNDPKP